MSHGPAMPIVSEWLAALERALERILRIPLRYLTLAVACSVLLLAARAVSPPGPWNPYDYGLPRYVSAVGWLGGLVLASAPLVALRSVTTATLLALAPLSSALLAGHQWSFTTFCGLVAVAAVATWQSARLALVPAALAVGTIVMLVTTSTTMLVPDGAVIRAGAPVDWDLTRRIQLVALYAVAVSLSFGAAMWLRSSALAAKRETDLTRRSAIVEGEAAAVGERARLARDLHDVVAHHVTLIAVRAETAPYTHPGLNPEARSVLAEVAADARSALEELRGVLGVLRRSEGGDRMRAPQPVLADVAALFDTATASGDTVTLEGDLGMEVNPTSGYVAYRVIQEALTNARRHAPRRPVSVTVRRREGHLVVRVVNGLVQDADSGPGAQRGLIGMRERVEALGGRLVAGGVDTEFVVLAELPL